MPVIDMSDKTNLPPCTQTQTGDTALREFMGTSVMALYWSKCCMLLQVSLLLLIIQ